MAPLSAIILAGGESRRMGRDKAALTLEGESLLARTVRKVGELADDVMVIGNRPEESVAGAPVIADDVARAGPMGGLLTGLRRVRHAQAIVVACDHPFLDARVLRYLAELAPGWEAVVPRAGNRAQPTQAVYARTLVDRVERRLECGERRLERLLDELRVRWVEVEELATIDPALRSLLNVNTETEWQRALRSAGMSSAGM
jgi:molybdopterin-guanine dinucleotide biosynthesis protein A